MIILALTLKQMVESAMQSTKNGITFLKTFLNKTGT